MQTLVHLFVSFIERIRSLVGMVIPIFAEAADFRAWPRWVRVLVTVILLAIILTGLFYLNRLEIVQTYLQKHARDGIRPYYLPILFLLLYALTWIAYFWWKLFNASDAAEYPDIEVAWREGMDKLRENGISVVDLPLYLVVGRPQGGDASLFLNSQQKIEFTAPKSDSAPVRIFAGPNAIYVTCTGASTWGKYIARLHDTEAVGGGENADATNMNKTVTPGQALEGVDQKDQDEFYDLIRAQSERALTPAEQARLHELGAMMKSAGARKQTQVRMGSDELAEGPRRLAYLCRLIERERRPWCPVNGALVLIPWAALGSDDLARTAVGVLSGDLATARVGLRMVYPQYVMVCDLEQAEGFDEFRRGFTAQELRGRIGQRMPLVPDRPAVEMPGVMETVAEWIRLNTVPAFVLNRLKLEWPPEGRKTNRFVPNNNRKLFYFLYDLFTRSPRLGRILSSGVTAGIAPGDLTDAEQYPLVGGCYFAATGLDERSQAFAGGVFQRLTEDQSQDAVSWSEAALREDRSLGVRASVLYVASAVIALATIAVVYFKLGGT